MAWLEEAPVMTGSSSVHGLDRPRGWALVFERCQLAGAVGKPGSTCSGNLSQDRGKLWGSDL